MAKKVLAVILSMLIVLCVIPFAVSADEEVLSPQQRVANWNENFSLVTAKLLDNERSTHWKYVAENNDELTNKMITYTALSLYDDAWKNGFDQSVSIDRAEEILVSLIEKIDANIGESKLSKVRKVLETAVDVEDFVQKVNDFIKISDVLDSAEWSTAFKYIGWAIDGENLYEEERERVIEAYSQILSVQAANDLYIDFLRYVAENTDYYVVQAAAENLIEDIEESIDSLITKEILSATGFAASKIFDTAARIALQSNAYAAVALKIYDKGTSIADTLWNTSDQYALMDQLYTSFFAETCAVDWANAADNDEWYEFAISTVLSLRKIGAQALYDLKVAQNEGIVNRVLDQINYNIGFGNIAELSFLNLAWKVLFEVSPENSNEVLSIVTVNSNAATKFGDMYLDRAYKCTEDGYYAVDFNYVNGLIVKTLFVTADKEIRIFDSADCFATASIEKLVDGKVDDWSFTNVQVGGTSEVSFSSTLSNGAVYNYTGSEEQENAFNEEFVYPEYNEVTKDAIVNAVKEIAKEEVKAKLVSLRDYIDQLLHKIADMVKSIFAKIK